MTSPHRGSKPWNLARRSKTCKKPPQKFKRKRPIQWKSEKLLNYQFFVDKEEFDWFFNFLSGGSQYRFERLRGPFFPAAGWIFLCLAVLYSFYRLLLDRVGPSNKYFNFSSLYACDLYFRYFVEVIIQLRSYSFTCHFKSLFQVFL